MENGPQPNPPKIAAQKLSQANTTANATANTTKSTLPYGQTDYGVAGGVEQSKKNMGWADEINARQVAGVQGQQASDVWRATGTKAGWGMDNGPQPNPPKIAAQKQ